MKKEKLEKILADHKLWLEGKGGERANLSYADLRGANLDFSVLPLRCGGLRWNIDTRLARQFAYHFCSMKCDDPEFIKLRNSMVPYANGFHRAEECGRLEPVPEQAQSAETKPEEENGK
jgi:hypothetical protein